MNENHLHSAAERRMEGLSGRTREEVDRSSRQKASMRGWPLVYLFFTSVKGREIAERRLGSLLKILCMYQSMFDVSAHVCLHVW